MVKILIIQAWRFERLKQLLEVNESHGILSHLGHSTFLEFTRAIHILVTCSQVIGWKLGIYYPLSIHLHFTWISHTYSLFYALSKLRNTRKTNRKYDRRSNSNFLVSVDGSSFWYYSYDRFARPVQRVYHISFSNKNCRDLWEYSEDAKKEDIKDVCHIGKRILILLHESRLGDFFLEDALKDAA